MPLDATRYILYVDRLCSAVSSISFVSTMANTNLYTHDSNKHKKLHKVKWISFRWAARIYCLTVINSYYRILASTDNNNCKVSENRNAVHEIFDNTFDYCNFGCTHTYVRLHSTKLIIMYFSTARLCNDYLVLMRLLSYI